MNEEYDCNSIDDLLEYECVVESSGESGGGDGCAGSVLILLPVGLL